LAHAKVFSAKFCTVIGNVYPHVSTNFGEFTSTSIFVFLYQILSIAV